MWTPRATGADPVAAGLGAVQGNRRLGVRCFIADPAFAPVVCSPRRGSGTCRRCCRASPDAAGSTGAPNTRRTRRIHFPTATPWPTSGPAAADPGAGPGLDRLLAPRPLLEAASLEHAYGNHIHCVRHAQSSAGAIEHRLEADGTTFKLRNGAMRQTGPSWCGRRAVRAWIWSRWAPSADPHLQLDRHADTPP
jgi:hypothetical protein